MLIGKIQKSSWVVITNYTESIIPEGNQNINWYIVTSSHLRMRQRFSMRYIVRIERNKTAGSIILSLTVYAYLAGPAALRSMLS